MLSEYEYQGLTMQRQQQRAILNLPITKASKLYFCLLPQIELKKQTNIEEDGTIWDVTTYQKV